MLLLELSKLLGRKALGLTLSLRSKALGLGLLLTKESSLFRGQLGRGLGLKAALLLLTLTEEGDLLRGQLGLLLLSRLVLKSEVLALGDALTEVGLELGHLFLGELGLGRGCWLGRAHGSRRASAGHGRGSSRGALEFRDLVRGQFQGHGQSVVAH